MLAMNFVNTLKFVMLLKMVAKPKLIEIGIFFMVY